MSARRASELAFDNWLAGEDGAKRVIQDSTRPQGRGRREHPPGAPRTRPGAEPRPAHPVPGLSRAQERHPRKSRACRLGGRDRHRYRRGAGDGQPARLQPERPRAADAGDLSQSRGHGPVRARLEHQAVHRGGRAGLGQVQQPTASSTPIRASSRSAPRPSRTSTTSAPFGLATVLAKSSNVGMAKLALQLEPQADLGHAELTSASAR